MKVKIDNKIYDSKKEPIMIILTSKNKKDISNMSKRYIKYCEYPDYMTNEEVDKFMKLEKEKINE